MTTSVELVGHWALAGGAIRRNSRPPLYLHFLNRELARAEGVAFRPAHASARTILAAVLTDAPLYASASLAWESGILDMGDLHPLLQLIQTKQLRLLSETTSLESFLSTSRQLYAHDRSRYPMYFDDPAGPYLSAGPNARKQWSASSVLERQLSEIVGGSIGHLRLLDDRDLSHVLEERKLIEAGLSRRMGRALTIALFRQQRMTTSQETDRAIARLLSMFYTLDYMTATDADILTGLTDLAYFDRLARFRPWFDTRAASIVLASIGVELGGQSVARRLMEERGSAAHARFLGYVTDATEAAVYGRQLSRGRGARKGVDRGWSLHELFPARAFRSVSGGEPGELYDLLSARMSQGLATAMASRPALREFMNATRSLRTISVPRVLVLVANRLERDAMIASVRQVTGNTSTVQEYASQHTLFHLGVGGGVELILAQSRAGTESPAGMTLTAVDVVDHVRPDAMILAGIAYGLRPESQQLGDILVSSQLRLWDHKKVTRQAGVTTEIIRGDKVEASTGLIDRFESATVDWSGAPVHTGLILSANTLVDDPDLVSKLRLMEPDAIGGEMEGAGLYSVGAKRGVKWIVVKGISDWGMAKDDEARPSAAQNAAQFTAHVILSGGLASISSR